MNAELLGRLSLPGDQGRPNEDRAGAAGSFAWVIDGATGLGDFECLDGPSDAAWLAETADMAIAVRLTVGETEPAALIAHAIDAAAEAFARDLVRQPEGRFQLPTASILVARFDGGGIDIAELGDCSLYAVAADRTVATIGSDANGRAREREGARLMIAHGATLKTPEVRRRMRESRAKRNTPDGAWLFGVEREAAAHVRRHRIDLARPFTALLATDGFAALVEDYGRTDAGGLVEAARLRGLASLGEDLRAIEQLEDPDCTIFPRFKPSDDATAVLVSVAD